MIKHDKAFFVLLFVISIMLFYTGCSKKQSRTDGVDAANTELYREFDNGSRIIYPDYYAGKYISEDGKTLFVCVTSAYDSELNFLLKKYDCVEFSEVEYSKNELYSLSERYKTELANNFPELDFFQTELDEKGNCVIIELDTETLGNNDVMNKLKDYFKNRPVVFGTPPTGYLY